ncbi:hypothetical protein ACERII_09795 [Evansella sp. AB-rgal1]|uniref:hypothetical protein n=1 Tax=Evansella sp. AB-rgal1 TaxID=3242696 RepID=UPI00359EC707
MKKRKHISLLVLPFLLFLHACDNNEEVAEPIVYEVSISGDEEPPPADLDELIRKTELIVKGSFGDILSKENMIRIGDLPDDHLYAEGHLYEFQVDEVFKGNIVGEIHPILYYGFEVAVHDHAGKHISNVMVPSPEYKTPDPTKQYILFLRKNPIGATTYSRSSDAYMIEIDQDQSMQFISERMEGQLSESIVLTNPDHNRAEHVVKVREGIYVDVFESMPIINNYLEEYHDLQALEDKLRSIR